MPDNRNWEMICRQTLGWLQEERLFMETELTNPKNIPHAEVLVCYRCRIRAYQKLLAYMRTLGVGVEDRIIRIEEKH